MPGGAAPLTSAGVLDLAPQAADLQAEVLEGLSAAPPRLPCKLLYDEAGCRLFERITRLPEYYPTRTEIDILGRCLPELAMRLEPGLALVEFGSGSSTKTRLLLRGLDVHAYVPIDISPWYLQEASRRLHEELPALRVLPVAADYTRGLRLPEVAGAQAVGFFPGGTIGNFDPEDAVAFLRRVARALGAGGCLIIGVDLKKVPAVLHAAYNDDDGVTALFNLNLLVRLNRELGADFEVGRWRHYAFYNPEAGRVEMHLVSAGRQTVGIGRRSFAFGPGDTIHTENSYKHTLDSFAALAARAGFEVERVWTDERCLFSVQLLRARPL